MFYDEGTTLNGLIKGFTGWNFIFRIWKLELQTKKFSGKTLSKSVFKFKIFILGFDSSIYSFHSSPQERSLKLGPDGPMVFQASS